MKNLKIMLIAIGVSVVGIFFAACVASVCPNFKGTDAFNLGLFILYRNCSVYCTSYCQDKKVK